MTKNMPRQNKTRKNTSDDDFDYVEDNVENTINTSETSETSETYETFDSLESPKPKVQLMFTIMINMLYWYITSSYSHIIRTLIGLVIGVVGYEHFARMNEFGKKFRLTHYLTYLANKSQQLWEHLGEQFAYISSYLYQLKDYFMEISTTLEYFLTPVGRILLGVYYFIKGYCKGLSAYKDSILIVIGSLLFGLVILVCMDYYFNIDIFGNATTLIKQKMSEFVKLIEESADRGRQRNIEREQQTQDLHKNQWL